MPLNASTLAAVVRNSAEKARALSSTLAVFGGLALLVAAFGLYGVTAHAVSLRTREIGVRISLGARAADVRRLFVREGLALASIGIGIGALASFAAARVLARFLFGMSQVDVTMFAACAAILVVIALVASYLPARRATRVDPMVALRHE